MLKLGRRLMIGALVMACTSAFAQVVTLSDGGSLASINAGTQGTGGLVDWTVGNSPNQVVQQIYLYRVGTGPVQVVNSISTPSIDQPTAYLANIGYTNATDFFDLNFRYLLTGASPSSADLAEVATLVNRGNSALTFSLYEYDFFSLAGSPGGTGTLLNSSTIQQVHNGAAITVGATPVPSHWMIDTSGNVASGIVSGTLSDASSPFTNATDLAFAFQWNVNLAPGQQWQMSKDKLLAVPEPTTLLTLGGLAVVALRRRRRAS